MENNKKESEKTKIIVRQDNGKSNVPHLTWGEYIHQVNSYKWWIIAVSLIGALAGFGGAKYLINPKREKITSSLSFRLPLNKQQDAFLDGTPFDGRNLVSKANVDAVIKSNSDFKNLNPDKVYSALSISPVEVTTNNETRSSKTEFNLVTSAKPFDSSKQAQAFIGALIDYEVNNVSLPKIERIRLSTPFTRNESEDLESIKNSSFSQTTSYLSSLDNIISANYKDLISVFGENAFVSDNSSLLSLSTAYSKFSDKMDLLEGEFTTNYYVNFQDGKEEIVRNDCVQFGKQYKDELNTVETNLIHTNELLTKLSNIKTPDFQIGKQITELTEASSSLLKQKNSLISSLKNIGYTVTSVNDTTVVSENPDSTTGFYPSLNFYKENKNSSNSANKEKAIAWKQGSEGYATSLSERYQSLSNQYTIANNATKRLYKNSANAIYVKEANNGKLTGHLSNSIVAVAGLVLGFFVSSLLLAEIGRNLEFKKKNEGAKAFVNQPKTEETKSDFEEEGNDSSSKKTDTKESHTNSDCDQSKTE